MVKSTGFSPSSLHLRLPKSALRRLQEVGIYCRTGVRMEYQQSARRYVVHGTESGGTVRELGRYITFAGPEGEPLEQWCERRSRGCGSACADESRYVPLWQDLSAPDE